MNVSYTEKNYFTRNIDETLAAVEKQKKLYEFSIQTLQTYKELMRLNDGKQFNVKIKEFIDGRRKYELQLDSSYGDMKCYRLFAYELDEELKWRTGNNECDLYFNVKNENSITKIPDGKSNVVLNYPSLEIAIDKKIESLKEDIEKLNGIDRNMILNVIDDYMEISKRIEEFADNNYISIDNKTLCEHLDIAYNFRYQSIY